MKYIVILATICLTTFSLRAQQDASNVTAADPAAEFIQSIQQPDLDFIDAYDKAREAGVSKATLLTGKTLYYLKNGDLEGLLKISADLESAKAEIDYGPDKVFVSEKQVLGLVRGLDAIKAQREERMGDLETAVKESFWFWPQWAGILGLDQLVLSIRGEEIREATLANLTIPMTTEIRNLEGSPVKLSSIAERKKAILLDFWASWCGPCIRLMPELKKKAEVLGAQGVYVAGLNTDDEEPLEKAAKVQTDHNMNMPWLVEDEAQTLSSLLMVDSIPRMALIAPNGELLWTGHPMDAGLIDALSKLNVSLKEGEKPLKQAD